MADKTLLPQRPLLTPSHCDQVTYIDLTYISQSFKKMTFLKKIDLHLTEFSQATTKEFKKPSDSFNRLIRLEKIHVDTPYCD